MYTMFNISSFLEKFNSQVGRAELNNKEICEIITLRSGIRCVPEQIEVKNYVLYVNVSPTFKQKLLMSKASILEELQHVSGMKITSIR